MCVCVHLCRYSRRLEEGTGCHGAGAVGGCVQQHCETAGNLNPFLENYMLLTVEPSLQPYY